MWSRVMIRGSLNRFHKLVGSVFLFSLLLGVPALGRAEAPLLSYSAIPFGQRMSEVLAQLQSAHCTVKTIGHDEYVNLGSPPPQGLLHTNIRAEFPRGIYLDMTNFHILYSQSIQIVKVECPSWKEIIRAYLFFTIGHDAKLFLVEKEVRESGPASQFFAALREVLTKVIGNPGTVSSGRFVSSGNVSQADLCFWEDRKTAVKSYLVVMKNALDIHLGTEAFVGHVWMPGWSTYADTAASYFEEKRRAQRKQLEKGKEF